MSKEQNLITELKKYGLRVRPYVKPPGGKHTFALTIKSDHPKGTITVNQGTAKVIVVGNKRLHQAAVTVHERGREVTKQVKTSGRYPAEPTIKEQQRKLKAAFPMIMPPKTRWSFRKMRCVVKQEDREELRRQGITSAFYSISGEVTAKVVNNTVNHFLLGIDETRNFIAPLRRQVHSIMEAHRVLKPVKRHMKKGSARQGEWFFIPCSREQVNKLNKMADLHADRVRPYRLGTTTHTVKSGIRLTERKKQVIYCRGYVTDARKGHHRSLFFPKWRRVVKNAEATVKVSPEQRQAARRRSRTWD